jgi:acylphosphatase
VEVFAIGTHSELAKLRRLLEQGPPAASVDAVVDENEEPSAPALTPFGVLR